MKKSVVGFSVALLFSLSVYSQEAVVESEKSSASETVSAEVTSVAEDFSGEIVSDGTADEISVSDEAEVCPFRKHRDYSLLQPRANSLLALSVL